MILLAMEFRNRYVRITVIGLVQGIGFRPFVAECAEELNIGGIVRNSGGIVIIYANADDDSLNKFTCKLEKEPPYGAVINSVISEDITKDEFCKECGDNLESKEGATFKIVDSSLHEDKVRLLPPDLPVCDKCIEELFDKNNRRYRYPFISCTSCGPRFSIMHAVPYDRDNTTMDIFKMCPDCFEEYTKKGDLRRHAQTISCHKCGPQLVFTEYIEKNNKGFKDEFNNEIALQRAISNLKDGKIGAILDIGGFHFTFSPYISEPARRLRSWKMREAKPFAVMFPDIASIKKYCQMSQREEELLKSDPRPIVLLNKKEEPGEELPFADEVLVGSDRVGAMLPCSPLQILLLKETGPLVMTSGNRGGEPIVTDIDVMKEYLGTGGPDFMLSHERKILTPLDDSIYQVNGDVVQIIRRARGLVPWPVDLPFELKTETFAAGGDLKAVFALGKADKAYLSAHFSDLDDLEAAKARDHAISHMKELLDINPEKAVCDKHPGYISVKKAEKIGYGEDKVLHVQHHLAHVMSVACEHDIKGTFVGIACDGTGFGDDGSIWGSEFFLCDISNLDARNLAVCNCDTSNPDVYDLDTSIIDKSRIVSVKHKGSLLPVKMIGGDEGSKDAVKTFFCYLHEAKIRGYIDSKDFDNAVCFVKETFKEKIIEDNKKEGIKENNFPDIRLLEAALDHNINTIRSSSMGRLFDAVSALLGICCYNSYEGECPAKLEICAGKAHNLAKINIRIIEENQKYYLDGARIIADMCRLIALGEDKGALALGFHKALSDAIVKLAEMIITDPMNISDEMPEKRALKHHESSDLDNTKLAISGGSFLNRLLNTDIQDICRQKGYKLYQNSIVPPGDGGLALGQLYLSQCIVK